MIKCAGGASKSGLIWEIMGTADSYYLSTFGKGGKFWEEKLRKILEEMEGIGEDGRFWKSRHWKEMVERKFDKEKFIWYN